MTVIQAISLFDVIELRPADHFSFASDADVDTEHDLGLRAIRLFEDRLGLQLAAEVRVEKRIPLAAGLGGGSSDAGTLLAALAKLARIEPESAEELAAELGSDVPFFVRGGTTLATGTGTDLMPLPSPTRLWFVIITPDVDITNKTTRLYGSLTPSDYTDGESARGLAGSIERGQELRLISSSNAFSRSLYEIAEIDRARKLVLDLGAPFVLPCGAGPSLFTVLDRWDDARDLAVHLCEAGLRAVACTSVGPKLNKGRLL